MLSGHTVSAAGVVGFLLSCLALTNQRLPGHLNLRSLLEKLRGAPTLCVPVAATNLHVQESGMATVSGTSASGDNVHLVIRRASDDCPLVLPLVEAYHGQMSVSSTSVPRLSGGEYSVCPPIDELHCMLGSQLKAVTGFKVTRSGHGAIEWDKPVDLRGLNLGLIHITSAGAALDPEQLPTLNSSCIITATLEQQFKDASSDLKKYVRKFKKKVERSGHVFLGSDSQSVRFRVKQVSRTVFNDVEDISTSETSESGLSSDEEGSILAVASSADGPQLVAVQQAISRQIVEVMGQALELDVPLMAAGVKSQAAMKIHASLQRELGLKLPRTLAFDYPTVRSIAEFATEALHSRSTVGHREQITRQTTISLGQDEASTLVSVRGQSIRAPGDVIDSESWWQSMCHAVDNTVTIPALRFDVQLVQAIYTHHGNFITGAELFDNRFFEMGVTETKYTDPSHRLLLEVAFSSAVQGGCSKAGLTGTSVGVYIGLCNFDWAAIQHSQPLSAYSAHGSDGSSASGRVSYLLALKGPCLCVNTACSSAAVALDIAHKNLHHRSSHSAIVGGCCLNLHPGSFAAMCSLHALSVHGRCKTFDNMATGYGRSEVSGAVFLEALSAHSTVQVLSTAVHQDGRSTVTSHLHTYISLLSSAVNQDGRSASFMALNGPSQQEVIAAARSQAHLTAAHCVETHGTGTALGDPIEVGALHQVMSGKLLSTGALYLGAIKSQIAHPEGAAATAGSIKALKVLELRCFPPNLHLRESNRNLDLDELNIFLSSGLELCEAKILGVSSFGFSGTNSHAVLGKTMATMVTDSAGPQVSPTWRLAFKLLAFPWWDSSCTNLSQSRFGTSDPDHRVHIPNAQSQPLLGQMMCQEPSSPVVSRTASILGFEYYAPNLCCPAADIEQVHNCPGRYTVGRGQQHVGFCSGEEDTVSMAMTVLERLVRSNGLGLEEIGRLEVGTESQVDRAKSTKSFLMGFFQPEGLHSVEGLDTYNACYGGTNALFSTVGWVQSAAWSRQYGVVVCSDPAVHPQQEALSGIGASAVGLLVGCEAMVVEPVRVSFIKHAW